MVLQLQNFYTGLRIQILKNWMRLKLKKNWKVLESRAKIIYFLALVQLQDQDQTVQ